MKNVMLWWPMLPPSLISELEKKAYNIVGIIQYEVKGKESISVQELYDTRDVAGPFYDKSLAALYRKCFVKYYKNISRVRIVTPRSKKLLPRFYSFESGSHTFDEAENRFFIHAKKLTALVKRLEVDAVWFSRPPHLGLDNLLFEICKLQRLETLVFQQSFFPERFFYGDSTESLFLNQASFANNVTLNDVEKPNLFYMQKNNKTKARATKNLKRLPKKIKENSFSQSAIRSVVDILKFRNHFFSASFLNLLVHGSRAELLKDLNNAEQHRQYKNYKLNAPIVSSCELPEKFVYFALHLQPEATTSEHGGAYKQQANAIESLLSILPSGWRLVVKENPKQGHFYRSPEFFYRLGSSSNIKFVSSSVSSANLIRRAEIVATITGTVGYEALAAGKAVVFFGNAWYQSVSGAHKFRWNLNLEWASQQVSNREIVREDIYALQRQCAAGVVYAAYSKLSEKTENELAAQTANSISKIDLALNENNVS